MAEELTFKAEGFELRLRLLGYEYPTSHDAWDANWLRAEIEVQVVSGTGARFTAARATSVQTAELATFRGGLAALDRSLNGKAVLATLEDELEIGIELANGKGEIAGYVRDHLGTQLEFEEVAIDQSYVRRMLRQMDAIVTAFPYRDTKQTQ